MKPGRKFTLYCASRTSCLSLKKYLKKARFPSKNPGHGSMAEQVLPKHLVRVRFPLPALLLVKPAEKGRFFMFNVSGNSCHQKLNLSEFEDPEIRCSLSIYYKAKEAQRVSANTMRILRRVLNDFCSWAEGHGYLRISEIDVVAIQAYMREKSLSCSPGTAHIYFRNLRTFSYYLEDLTDGGLRSPFHSKALRAPKLPQKKKPSATPEMVLHFVNALEGEYVLRNRAFFLTAFDSGLRLAEICQLRVEDLDLTTGRIEVLRGKGSKYRVSFVSTVTIKAIRRYLKSRVISDTKEPLFLSESGSFLTAQGMQSVRYKAEKKSGICFGGFHALRRGFAKTFLQQGGDLFTLQNLLGHTELSTTRGYVQMTPEELQDAYARSSPLDRLSGRGKK